LTARLTEVRAVIRFLWGKKIKPAEIHRELCSVYGKNVMSDSAVRKWCRLLGEGRTNVHDEETMILLKKSTKRLERTGNSPLQSSLSVSLRSHELSSTTAAPKLLDHGTLRK